MPVTVLFIGDPHFQVNNIQEVDMFLEKITQLALEKSPDIIVIAGDLLHTHEKLHTIPLNKAYKLVDEMRKISKTYVLVGNHDYQDNSQFLTQNHWMNGMKEWKNTVIVDTVVSEIIRDEKFIFVPYVFPGRFQEALQTHSESWIDASCIFAHQEFLGCKMGAIVSIDGDKWPLTHPFVISGHIHSKQRPQENIYYTGSAMQHAFGESEHNIIAHLSFDRKMYDIEEIDLGLPRKKIVYMDVEELDKYSIPDTEDQIKVTLKGDYNEFKAVKKSKKYKDMIDNGVKVIFKPKKIDNFKDQIVNNDDTTDFKNILFSIVTSQKNPYLMQGYELIVNDKKMEIDDILFL
jgi:DNA repair exonuclease SbcCD nuclease subunit